MNGPPKVMAVGAGIGGLTAAIALHRAGFEVSVFERAAELEAVGAGLLLAANAQKALGMLGLAEAVARLGTPASAAEIRSQRGEVLASIPAAELEKKVGASNAAVHRADLQALLVREAGDAPAAFRNLAPPHRGSHRGDGRARHPAHGHLRPRAVGRALGRG